MTIKKGTYEGQLVIGDSFVNPVKNFTIEKDDDTVILQFEVSRDGKRVSLYLGEEDGGLILYHSICYQNNISILRYAGF